MKTLEEYASFNESIEKKFGSLDISSKRELGKLMKSGGYRQLKDGTLLSVTQSQLDYAWDQLKEIHERKVVSTSEKLPTKKELDQIKKRFKEEKKKQKKKQKKTKTISGVKLNIRTVRNIIYITKKGKLYKKLPNNAVIISVKGSNKKQLRSKTTGKILGWI